MKDIKSSFSNKVDISIQPGIKILSRLSISASYIVQSATHFKSDSPLIISEVIPMVVIGWFPCFKIDKATVNSYSLKRGNRITPVFFILIFAFSSFLI
ncbi:hypothetical protein D1872_285100 [compost metagenome]